MHTVSRFAMSCLLSVVAFFATTAVAAAGEPTTWDSGESLSLTHWFIVLVGAPVALWILLSLLGIVTSRKNHVLPEPSSEVAPFDVDPQRNDPQSNDVAR